jgi:glycosyltransferase involved in cell wall biosynthesis
MEKVSVTIITLNEEAKIGDCLSSVAWADEVIVSDSGSTDRTVEICRDHGATVYEDEWHGFGAQKNLCAERAGNDWVLNVDSDERVTPGLRDEIERTLSGAAVESGYLIPRKNYFGDRWIRRCGWYPDHNLRLYRKDRGRFSERKVHEAVEVDGPTGRLENPLVHLTYADVSDYLRRMDRYSTLAAEQMLSSGRRAGVTDLLLRPPFTFLKMYVLRGGFLEGVHGVMLSALYSCYTLSKYAKLWEMNRGGGASS